MQQAPDYKQLYEQQSLLVEDLQQKLAALTHQVAEMQRLIFGSKTEKFIPSLSEAFTQLNLDMPVSEPGKAPSTAVQQITYQRPVKTSDKAGAHPVRMKLPEHLERREIFTDPDGTQGMRKIGEEITEELEYEPGKLYVNRYIRPRYVSADNSSIVIAPMIDRPLPKAIAGPGLQALDCWPRLS